MATEINLKVSPAVEKKDWMPGMTDQNLDPGPRPGTFDPIRRKLSLPMDS